MTTATTTAKASSTSSVSLVVAWLAVGIPLLWGVTETISKALALFR